jgi:hypothetical protein
MKTWLWLILTVQTIGCAQGYYDSRPAYEAPATTNWIKNPETDAEYHQRIWWENYESERDMLPRPFRGFP